MSRCFKFCLAIALLNAAALSGCSSIMMPQESCRVLDADLARGAYRGGCKNGLADGYGEVSGESTYRGDFRAGKKQGKGIKVMPNGDRYAGEFSDDFRHGQGSYIWGERTPWAGDRYEGEYQYDKRHGRGVYLWGSGDRYEGLWENDLRMGLSVMETRRAQRSSVKKELASGVAVCTEIPLGLNRHQRIRGLVESIMEKNIIIRITGMDGTRASYRGQVIRVGDAVEDDSTNWQSCSE